MTEPMITFETPFSVIDAMTKGQFTRLVRMIDPDATRTELRDEWYRWVTWRDEHRAKVRAQTMQVAA